jgi:hypothetical protein
VSDSKNTSLLYIRRIRPQPLQEQPFLISKHHHPRQICLSSYLVGLDRLRSSAFAATVFMRNNQARTSIFPVTPQSLTDLRSCLLLPPLSDERPFREVDYLQKKSSQEVVAEASPVAVAISFA